MGVCWVLGVCSMTDEARAGPCVGQGSAGGALNSQFNLDRGIQAYFSGSSDEYYYGRVRCQGVIFQDDTGRVSSSLQQAQSGNTKLNAVFKDKGLQAHPDKSCFIVCGSKEYKKKIKEELILTPLSVGEFIMKQEVMVKYLGMILHEDGVQASIRATVEDRIGKIRGATFEIRALIEDFRMAALGGLMGAWILWKKALIPSLLAGCCNWVGIDQKTVDQLDEIQNLHIRVQNKTSQKCPKVLLRAETSMLGMKHRVWKEKIMFIIQLRKLREESLAREILGEQRNNDWPGLAQEVSKICQDIGLEDVNSCEVSKDKVNEMIFYHHYREIKEEMSSWMKLRMKTSEMFRVI